MLGHVGLGPFWRIRKQLVGAAVEDDHHHTPHTKAGSGLLRLEV
jgi:hypothetical protein